MTGKGSTVRNGVHPAVQHAQAILAQIPEKTGRSAAAWKRLILGNGPAGSKERRQWLKQQHGLGGTTARLLVEHAEGRGAENLDPKAYLAAARGYVDSLYEGKRAALRPLHDRLAQLALELGPDIKICPCKTMVPVYRNHVIAQIKPATLKRIDLGLALKGSPRKPPARVRPTGGLEKGDRITHQVALTGTGDLDATVQRWLAVAYELDA